MDKNNFPAVKAKSPTDALKMLGIDEGAILEYNPATGMYVVEVVDDAPEYESYFAQAIGLSKGLVDSLIESGAFDIEQPEEGPGEDDEEINEAEVITWDKADLTMICGRCGTEDMVTEAIGAATLYMPTNSEAETRLVCSECGNGMSLSYKNGSMFTEEEKAVIAAKNAEQEAKELEQKAEYIRAEHNKSIETKEDEPQKESE